MQTFVQLKQKTPAAVWSFSRSIERQAEVQLLSREASEQSVVVVT